MRIGVLTSSRADYGIYLPLLLKLKADPFFELEIIAFGTHLSKFHGFTITEIEQNEYNTVHKISSLLSNDDEQSIGTSYGLTAVKFADFWQSNKYDLVFCLGDRFEMSAAVQAGIPFGIKFAHIHGGETTLGAIDNIYRHQITIASILHFTAAAPFSEKITELIGSSNGVHTVGSLSLDGIENFKPIEKSLFYDRFKIPYQEFALVTFHPETIATQLNKEYALEMRLALAQIAKKLFLVITMPNADTMGSVYRSEIEKLKNESPDRVLCIENFGRENYFSAMKYSKLLIGNTSSGILEAASFGKYVVNVGNRQEGRLQSQNTFNVAFRKESIVEVTSEVSHLGDFNGENYYHKDGSTKMIIKSLKKYYANI
ncbi:UDP-N-acetylglucosamine 2-epimerase (hydrolyzing) [Pseudarcicella sp. GAP-15]|nr:UDP-N-acetylglucosamine 2-epimerase (hydrolyzing) [Pseudarcicella sp. GAP-15]